MTFLAFQLNKTYIRAFAFQMKTSEISCYYCGYCTEQYQDIIHHLVSSHNDHHLKVKQYTLCPVSAKIEYTTKTYPIKPIDLSPQETIVFNSSLNKIHVMRETPTSHEEAASLKRKRR